MSVSGSRRGCYQDNERSFRPSKIQRKSQNWLDGPGCLPVALMACHVRNHSTPHVMVSGKVVMLMSVAR